MGLLLAGVSVGPLFLQLCPITDRTDLLPDLVGIVTVVHMGVGGFLYLGVVPRICIRIVCPGNHIGQEMILVRRAVQRTVDDLHSLGAGDIAVGLEGVITVSIHEAKIRGGVDERGGPVLAHIVEHVGTVFTSSARVMG